MIRLKRGDTFKLEAEVLGDGVVIPGGIGTWTIASQIRTGGGTLVDTLKTTITDAAACTYTLEESAAGVTEGWPLGRHEMDIEYIVSSQVISTETVTVLVAKDVTR